MQTGTPIHDTHELELASELLEASQPAEVDGTVRRVFRTTGTSINTAPPPQSAAALGAMLRDVARQTLPNLGTPAAGLAEQAGSLLGLELEGLSPPDQEFEAARQLVRLASSAYAHLASAPRYLPAEHAARNALASAARQYAPGVLTQIASPAARNATPARPPQGASGHWVRRGNDLIVHSD